MKDQAFFLSILSDLMMYLRHMEDDQDMQLVRRLGYAFHNVPGHLINFTDEDSDLLYRLMRSKADGNGIGHLLDYWEEKALNRNQPCDCIDEDD